jgi:hypothetical protein
MHRKNSEAAKVTSFSESDYSADVAKVIAHAAQTGTAVVSDARGTPRIVITIPTSDLPEIDE